MIPTSADLSNHTMHCTSIFFVWFQPILVHWCENGHAVPWALVFLAVKKSITVLRAFRLSDSPFPCPSSWPFSWNCERFKIIMFASTDRVCFKVRNVSLWVVIHQIKSTAAFGTMYSRCTKPKMQCAMLSSYNHVSLSLAMSNNF